MPQPATIEIFSELWCKGLLISATVIVLLLLYFRSAGAVEKHRFASVAGWLLIGDVIAGQLYQLYLGHWNLAVSLPLQLCSITALLSGIVLIWRKTWAFECLLFWGISGSTYSLITPQSSLGLEGWYAFDYYISHAGIIFSALYLSLVLGFQPRRLSWLRVFAWTQGLAIIVGMADISLNVNYMFLLEKPNASNPLVVGDWPWYLLAFEIAALVHFYVIYQLFRSKKKLVKEHDEQQVLLPQPLTQWE